VAGVATLFTVVGPCVFWPWAAVSASAILLPVGRPELNPHDTTGPLVITDPALRSFPRA
jgi:hypothetical protein